MTLEELKSLKIGDIIDVESSNSDGRFKIVEFERCEYSVILNFCKTCPGSIELKNLDRGYIISGCRKQILEYCKIYHQNIEFITEEEFLV